MQLQILTIILNGTLSAPLFVAVAEVIRACSEFLKRLSLHNAVYEWFDPPKGLSAIIMECKKLARLTITIAPSTTSNSHRDLVLEFFLQEVVPALPELNALQVMPFTVVAQAKLFEDGFTHSHGVTQGPAGLRLLAMQSSKSPMPASLRYLFIGNRSCVTEELMMGLSHLSNLEELYLAGLGYEHYTCLLQHGLPAVRQSLRALVLDFPSSMIVQEHALAVIDLPRLQFLAMPNVLPLFMARNAFLPALQLRCCADHLLLPFRPIASWQSVSWRCPQLTVFACQISAIHDVLFLRHLVREGAPHLKTLQVSFDEASRESYGAMWRSLLGAHCLQNLNVILRKAHIYDLAHVRDIEGNQVREMLEAALQPGGLTLPKSPTSTSTCAKSNR
ncbi:hypothetical protein COCOBI_08-5990 [Coccomyxa sp. Obi]|nr:hypothetical protein COCOBI_08-5990 [Coccomyxa sp. Obi]